MNKPKQDQSRRSMGKKHRYRPPRLEVYGDIRVLTGAKPGNKNDGGGNPKTKH